MRVAQRFDNDIDEPPQEVMSFHKGTAASEIQRMIEKFRIRVVTVFDLYDSVGVVFEEIR